MAPGSLYIYRKCIMSVSICTGTASELAKAHEFERVCCYECEGPTRPKDNHASPAPANTPSTTTTKGRKRVVRGKLRLKKRVDTLRDVERREFETAVFGLAKEACGAGCNVTGVFTYSTSVGTRRLSRLSFRRLLVARIDTTDVDFTLTADTEEHATLIQSAINEPTFGASLEARLQIANSEAFPISATVDVVTPAETETEQAAAGGGAGDGTSGTDEGDALPAGGIPIWIIGVAAGGGLCVGILLGVGVCIYRRKQRPRGHSKMKEQEMGGMEHHQNPMRGSSGDMVQM
jgi:hypothetical protein